jgi:hypothetical protein
MRSHGMSNVSLSEFFEKERRMLKDQQQRKKNDKIGGEQQTISSRHAAAAARLLAEDSLTKSSYEDTHHNLSDTFVKNLPYVGKMLLLSAFVAGWNPSTSDNRLFGKSKGVKRRRKDPMLMNKKAMKIQDSKLLGPGTFSVDRMIGILKSLFKFEGDPFEEENEEGYNEFESFEEGDYYQDRLRAKVHCQETYQLIKTFTSMSIFSPGGADSAGGSMHCEHFRLQCNLREQAAHKIAKDLGINLNDYLVYV